MALSEKNQALAVVDTLKIHFQALMLRGNLVVWISRANCEKTR